MEILSDHVFSHVSDTKTPQGILLVMEQRSCEIREMLELDAQGRKPLLMVLDNLQDPGNLGTILRAGEAAGVNVRTFACYRSRNTEKSIERVNAGVKESKFAAPFEKARLLSCIF